MFAFLIALLVLALPQAPAQPQAVVCSNVWQSRTPEFEEYLKAAKVDKITDIPIGVMRPRRAYLAPGGLIGSFAWKPIRPGVQSGYFESYKSEIAAYELDKLLGMNMVPVAVERRVENDLGAAIMWVEGVRSWKACSRCRNPRRGVFSWRG